MSIIASQSFKNVIITYVGFGIGAINTLFLYTRILGDTYYGIVGFILSTANILMPLMAFGVQNTLIKYYSAHKTETEKSDFLTFILYLPLFFLIPFCIVFYFFESEIAQLITSENPILENYVWIIPWVGLCMAYFEIFYAWVKVHYRAVFGSFVREIGLRLLITLFLILVYYKVITADQFIYSLLIIYFLSMLVMKLYAFSVRKPTLTFQFPKQTKAIIIYSSFIILSSGIAMLLLDIDKFMLAQYISIQNIAYYSVAIFIAIVVSVPGRAMHQIVHPITAKLMADDKHDELNDLYKKTSINLQVIGGLIYIGIVINIQQIYNLLPPQYSIGIPVVILVGGSKYLDLLLGNNNSIIFNSKYYETVLFLGVGLAVLTVVLNMFFIPIYDMLGAGLATLISITLYSWSKFYLIVKKMKLFPFTRSTLKSLVVTVVFFGIFYFWDFQFYPLINIILKASVFAPLYLYCNYKLQISKDINGYTDQFIVFVKRKLH